MASDDRADIREDRRRRIREAVLTKGFVRATDLAAEYDVSLMTIHRDLDFLQTQGWLRKVRGGATGLPSAQFHGTVAERMSANSATKQQLARAAATLIGPGQTIILDDSTTCLHLTRELTGRTPLTVLTNSLPAVNALAREPGISLIALGGSYFPRTTRSWACTPPTAWRPFARTRSSCRPRRSRAAAAITRRRRRCRSSGR